MKFLLATLAALCVGCSTTPPSNPTAATRVYDIPAATSTEPARVQVIRDEGFVNAIWSVQLSLNGRKIASLGLGELVEFKLDPGAHQLSAAASEPFGLGQPRVLEITIAPKQQAIYRVGFDGGTGALVFYRDMR